MENHAETKDDLDWNAALMAAFGPELDSDGSPEVETRALLGASRIILGDREHAAEADHFEAFRGGRLGRYEIAEEIARGAVGVIYRGRDVDIGRDVALKVLKSDLAKEKNFLWRFLAEAQINGQLQHPGIAPVYDFGLDELGQPFFAMRLIQGRTFEEILADRAHPAEGIEENLSILERVADTIAFAHSRGVIHRDIKPANIMVGNHGEVQVMDWGFAKVLEHEELVDSATSATEFLGKHQSVAGSIMGTPAYMSPEQAQGRIDELSYASDVFALGSLLSEILTGIPAYQSDAEFTDLDYAMRGDLKAVQARLEAVRDESELASLCGTCLAVNANDRPQSAQVITEAIQTRRHFAISELNRVRIRAAEARGRENQDRRIRRLAYISGALVLGLALLLGAQYYRHHVTATAFKSALPATLERAEELASIDKWDSSLEVLGALESRAEELSLQSILGPSFERRLARHRQGQSAQNFVAELARVENESGDDLELAYQELFKKEDFALGVVPNGVLAARIREKLGQDGSAGAALGLEHWADHRLLNQGNWQELTRLAALCDPEDERSRLRDWMLLGAKTELRAFITKLPATADPMTIELAAIAGDRVGLDRKIGTDLLNRAYRHAPLVVAFNKALASRLAGGKAITHLEFALSQQPENRQQRMQLARLYFERGEEDVMVDVVLAGIQGIRGANGDHHYMRESDRFLRKAGRNDLFKSLLEQAKAKLRAMGKSIDSLAPPGRRGGHGPRHGPGPGPGSEGHRRREGQRPPPEFK